MSFLSRRLAAVTSKDGLQVIQRVDNEPLLSCCRHLAAQRNPDGRLQPPLAALNAEFARLMADPVLGETIRTGEQLWPAVAPHLLDLLLAVAGAALATDPSLTGLIADNVLLVRRGSRAAWRLRAQAHEEWGDLGAAISAHEEYLALVKAGADLLGVRSRVRDLRELRASREELAAALSEAAEFGLRLPRAGAPELLVLLSRPTRQQALDVVLEDFIADLSELPMAELSAAQDVLHAAVRCRRTAALRPGPLPESEAGALGIVRLGDLRGWLADRTICLVAPDATGHERGALIESYDLIGRFTPFWLDPVRTGRRTDLLITRHDQTVGWDQPTDLRFILAEDPRDWVRAVRRQVLPGAQRALLDKTLRRPAHQQTLIGDEVRPGRPSDLFQVLRLLDHLDVSPRIDLIGYDLNAFQDVERHWLSSRVRAIDEQRISLR